MSLSKLFGVHDVDIEEGPSTTALFPLNIHLMTGSRLSALLRLNQLSTQIQKYIRPCDARNSSIKGLALTTSQIRYRSLRAHHV